MKRFMLNRLKGDEGYSLGLVLIFVMAVGTVLGAVMMSTQISADAQGHGVGQLQSANATAIAVSDVLELYRQEADAQSALQVTQNQPNCGLPSDFDGVQVSCDLISTTSKTEQTSRIIFTTRTGHAVERFFTVSVDPTSGTQQIIQAKT